MTYENFRFYTIFDSRFKFRDLLQQVEQFPEIYEDYFTVDDLYEWMEEYDFDRGANCVWVLSGSSEEVENNIKNIEKLKKLEPELQNPQFISKLKKLKHKSFYDKSLDKDGFIIPDSEIYSGIFLYIFNKNRKEDLTKARQKHGFKYQNKIMNLNNFTSDRYTGKWDSIGKISNEYINYRLDQGYDIELYYEDNIKNIKTYNSIPKKFKNYYPWSIKYFKKGNSIDMSDAKRIFSINENFMLCVGFYDIDPNYLKEEYVILINYENWKKYLPKIDIYEIIEEMIIYAKTDKDWEIFKNKTEKISKDSIIKLAPKRDSKGQLRMQCRIPNSLFFNEILSNNDYLKIY